MNLARLETLKCLISQPCQPPAQRCIFLKIREMIWASFGDGWLDPVRHFLVYCFERAGTFCNHVAGGDVLQLGWNGARLGLEAVRFLTEAYFGARSALLEA